MPSSHGYNPSSSGSYYSYPLYPFPWPETLTCGDAYINWPAGKDLALYSDFTAEAAVPESMIQVGRDQNITNVSLSMVFTKPKWHEADKNGTMIRKFVPLYRDQVFSTEKTSDAYIEYLGRPSELTPSELTKNKLNCDEPYHLITIRAPDPSIGDTAVILWDYNLFGAQGSDFMLRLYLESDMVAAGAAIYTMDEDLTGQRCAQPIAQSGIFTLCDSSGKYANLTKTGTVCNIPYDKYWDDGTPNGPTLNTTCASAKSSQTSGVAVLASSTSATVSGASPSNGSPQGKGTETSAQGGSRKSFSISLSLSLIGGLMLFTLIDGLV